MDDEEEKTAGVVAYLSVRENPASCICVIAIATKSIASKVRRQIARCFLRMFALCSFVVLTQKRDIWMKNEETKIPRTGAYLSYVRTLFPIIFVKTQ